MGCCSNKGCCKTQISKEELDEIKKLIKSYKFLDYIDENSEHLLCAEVELEGYILEIENIKKEKSNIEYLYELVGRHLNEKKD